MRVRSSWAPLLRLALPSLVLAMSSRADAISFTPYRCSQCPTMTEVGWTYSVSSANWELPTDPNCSPTPSDPCPHYINYLDNSRYISANPFVTSFGMRFDAFSTESGFDTVCYGEDGPSPTCLSGTPGTGWRDFTVSQNFQRQLGKVAFHADVSVTKTGFNIGRARVCCSGIGLTGTALAVPYRRMTGVLLATNDVVYFRSPASSNKNDAAVLWAPSGVDFDLFAKCNSLPTPTSYNYSSQYSGTTEYIKMPAGACPGGTWYYAVASYSGSGPFNFVVQGGYASQSRTIRAGTEWNASSAQLDQMAANLAAGAKYLYGSTEGTQVISQIDLYNSVGCNNCAGQVCDLCFRGGGLWYISTPCSSRVDIYDYCRPSARCVGAAMTTRWLCAGDEWDGQALSQCGHTILNLEWGGPSNNVCYDGDHKDDKDPNATPSSLTSAWAQASAAGVTPWTPSETPDNYDYQAFDFHGNVGNVIRH